jgi:hypothetical protein
MTLGADGNVWVTEQAVDKYARVTPDGVITEFTGLNAPGSIAVSSAKLTTPSKCSLN